MVANKHITKIVYVVMAIAVILCILAVGCSEKLTELFGGTGVKMEYETKLFDRSEVMSVDIRMDEDEWEKMLSNAMSEEYYSCDVEINGETVKNVAIRPKGNTSLSSIVTDPDTDRFSLKLEFDHFENGQTCYGLDKLILNNNYADATNMKEAVIYDMYRYLGAQASLYNYAKVSINGEYWGVYLALEGVEESFSLRNFGTQDGELYKPDSMEMGGGEKESTGFSKRPQKADSVSGNDGRPSFGGFPGGGFDPENMPEGVFNPENMPDGDFNPENMPDGDFDPENMPGGGFTPGNLPDQSESDSATQDTAAESKPDGNTASDSGTASTQEQNGSKVDSSQKTAMGGFGMGSGGANLNYSDDELDSYSTIWDGEITESGTMDHKRVIKALKNISEGTDLEKYLEIDNVLKYMAVHTFSVNMDSLSGSMAHNYYLYESKGKLNLFPWDYNLSFGGMSMGNTADATEMVNDAIDTPFSGTHFFDALLENEEYLSRYHAYLQQLVDEYVKGGRFEEVYEQIRTQIDPLVETDPTAFYNYEEYQTAAELLYQTVQLRAESIDGQLKGTIPSTDQGQKEDSSNLIDASMIDVKAMGQMNMGGNAGGSLEKDKAQEQNEEASSTETATENSGENSTEHTGENAVENAGRPGPENMPAFEGMPGAGRNQSKVKNVAVYAACFIGMLIALGLLKCYKRRR